MIRASRFVLVCMLFALLVPAALADRGEVRIERTFELGSGGTFELDTDFGSVEVRVRSPRDDLEDEVTFEFDASATGVRVTAKKKGGMGWFRWGRGVRMHWEIEVPDGVDVTIDTSGGSIRVEDLVGVALLDTSGGSIRAERVDGNVNADTSGGGIHVADVTGNALLDTSGGGIEVERVGGNVNADTSGGGIRIEDVAGDIRADTSGGGIHIDEAGGRVEADTSGGPITVTFAAGNARGGRLETSGGGIKVYVDPGVGLDVEAGTSGGGVRCELPVPVQGKLSRSHLEGKLNGGGESLHLYSSGGGIVIDAR